MGARTDVQTGLAEAMDDADLLADTVENFTATRTVTSDTFDPATGTYTSTTSTFTGRWIRDEFTRQELDSQHIEATDIKRLVLQNETTWVPAVDDVVDGYRVVDYRQDGALAHYEIQLRRT